MKISICDICETEGNFVVASYRSGFKSSLKLDLCEKHKNWGQGKTREQFNSDYYTLVTKGASPVLKVVDVANKKIIK